MTKGDDLKISRKLCIKPQEQSQLQPRSQSPLRVPGHRPTDWEKRFLLWAGHFKKPEDIPETVSWKALIIDTLLEEDFWVLKENGRPGNKFPKGVVRLTTIDKPPEITKKMIETIRAAKTTLRVKCSYLMIALTILGCIVMVIKGKQAIKRHESLTSINLEKKAQWREEGTQATSAKP